MKRINTIDLYVDGNDPSTGVVDNDQITKTVLVDNADADTLQVAMPVGDETDNFSGGGIVFGLTAPVSPKLREAARQAWKDAKGTEPTEDELLFELANLLNSTGIGVVLAGVEMSNFEIVPGEILPGDTQMFSVGGFAQVCVAIRASASPNATRAKATLTFISE